MQHHPLMGLRNTQVLLERGASRTVVNAKGQTALDVAQTRVFRDPKAADLISVFQGEITPGKPTVRA